MRRLAEWMRRLADRIDHHGAPKAIGWSFRFVQGKGIEFVEDPLGNRPPRGCPLWYLGDDSYQLAHDAALREFLNQRHVRTWGEELGTTEGQ